MQAPSPAFSLYPKDILSDEQCTAMTHEEFGMYVRLLAHAWLEGSIPLDKTKLGRLLKINPQKLSKVWPAISPCWDVLDVNAEARGVQRRLEEERRKQLTRQATRSENGTQASANRWGETSVKASRSERLRLAREKGTHTEDEWQALCDVTGRVCLRCGVEERDLVGKSLTRDHIKLISDGGSDSIENLQPVCKQCNSAKGNDETDLRPADWRERLTRRLAERVAIDTSARVKKASKRVATRGVPSPSPSPSPSSLLEETAVSTEPELGTPSPAQKIGKVNETGWVIQAFNRVFDKRIQPTPGNVAIVTEAIKAGYTAGDMICGFFAAKHGSDKWYRDNVNFEMFLRYKGGNNPATGRPAVKHLDALVGLVASIDMAGLVILDFKHVPRIEDELRRRGAKDLNRPLPDLPSKIAEAYERERARRGRAIPPAN